MEDWRDGQGTKRAVRNGTGGVDRESAAWDHARDGGGDDVGEHDFVVRSRGAVFRPERFF